MIQFGIKLADIVYGISAIYEDTRNLCEKYLTDQSADVLIEITKEDIEKEREITIREALQSNEFGEGRVPVFADGYLETTAVYRKIADDLSYREACVFHGALIEKDGEGFLFTAASGTGKTTHILNWIRKYPQTRVVNGDKPILKLANDQVLGFGTPWSGKEGMQTNSSVPIKAIILLERGEENRIETVDPRAAVPNLLAQCYRPHDAFGMKRALEMCLALSRSVSLYRLHCNMDPGSARVAYEGMKDK